MDLTDASEFQIFYQRTWRRLWAYLYRVLGSSSLADDLAQEAFCRLLSHPPPLTEEPQLRAYLFRVASNLMADHGRRLQRERRLESERPDGERAQPHPDRAHDLAATLLKLRPRERALLWLAYVEGSDHQEIASALGLKQASVRVLLFRARHKLARLLVGSGLAPGARS
jgi:RNA polymerase sigma-70 factor (ECF subfamily)